jgi:hypothetical protein
MKAIIRRITVGMLVLSVTICCQVSDLQAADAVRTLQPRQSIPTARTQVPQLVVTLVSVSRASKARVSLIPGGKETLTLYGSGLDAVSSAAVLSSGGMEVPNIEAQAGSGSSASRTLTLTAETSAGAGNYQVRLVAGTQTINLPATVLSVAVNAPLVVHPSGPLPVKKKVLPLSPSLVKTGNARIEGVQDTMRPSGGKETGVAGKPSENDLNNAVRGSIVYPKQQRSASGLKLSQPSPLAPLAPPSPGQFGDRSGLPASIQRKINDRNLFMIIGSPE